MEYIRLTNEQRDDTGRSIIICKFKDTCKCPIHNGGNCGNCEIFNRILEQLHGFENAWEEFIKCRSDIIYDKLI